MSAKPSILLVDDDVAFSLMLKGFLERKGFLVVVARSAAKALELLQESPPALILSDYRLPDLDGLELLRKIRSLHPEIPVLIMTGYGEIRLAVKTIREGAVDYLTKPVQQEELLELIRNYLKNPGKQARQPQLASETSLSAPAETFVSGESFTSRSLDEHIRLVAPTNYAVLILGESGTGKEFAARRIHQLSPRSEAPFVAVDCGAVSGELAAGEFFGYLKGAFTGAATDKPGVFEQAGGGTIFLDEIGNMNYENQVRLLRLLQEKKVKRLGATQDTEIDVRILAATNENLKQAILEGTFREDLFHRLNEFAIYIPSLQERKEDIVIFATHLLAAANQELGKQIKGFSEAAWNLMHIYTWPGNLREMKNVIKRAALLTRGNIILPESLPLELKMKPLPETSENLLPESVAGTTSLKTMTAGLEKEKIIEALQKFRYNRSETATYLGIDRKTLYNRMKRYGIN